MSKIDSLRDEIEFLKEQQPEEHIKDEIALLENELTGSFSELDSKTLKSVFSVHSVLLWLASSSLEGWEVALPRVKMRHLLL